MYIRWPSALTAAAEQEYNAGAPSGLFWQPKLSTTIYAILNLTQAINLSVSVMAKPLVKFKL